MTCASVGNGRVLSTLVSLAALICLAGCGGNGTTPTPLAAITIELAPVPASSALSVGPGDSLKLAATVFDESKNGVTWSISPLNFGTLSDATSTTVTYVAPASFTASTTVTVVATSITNPTATASIQISASPITTLLTFPQPNGQQGPPVPAADLTVNQGDVLSIQAEIANNGNFPVLTWTLSPPTGVGSLAPFSGTSLVNTTSSLVNYTAPASVSSPTTVTVTATSAANSNATASLRITVLPSGGGPNVAVLNVDGGPVPGQVYTNGAFLNGVTICNPGSPPGGALPFPICQTIDGILVDTGSYGLRILQSEIPLLTLPTMSNGNSVTGSTLENCYSFPDGSYLWGPVSQADLYIAGEAASSYISLAGTGNPLPLPVQVISSSNATVVPDGCSNGGTNLNTPQLLGANGILGVGPEPTDCTIAGLNYCDGSVQPVPPNVYYACPTTTGCGSTDSPVLVNAQQQVTNPIPLFLSVLQTPRGAIIDLPSVAVSEPRVAGTITFADFLVGAKIYTLDSKDNFTTIFNGQNLTSSFIDSGSNAFYFPDPLPACDVNIQFFCPSSPTNLSAINVGATQSEATIDFGVSNADNLFSSYPGDAAFGVLAGPSGTGSCSAGTGACSFEWGLPFFYGRAVFTKIDACTPTAQPCPPTQGAWWAY